MLRPVKVLAGKLPDSTSHAVFLPALFQPPGIETESISAGHAAWPCQCAQIASKVRACLPNRGRMKVQAFPTEQGTEIDIHAPSKTVPARQPFLLLALHVPKTIADVLQIESDTPFLKPRPLTSPISKNMAPWALPSLMAIRTAKRSISDGLTGSERLRVAHRETQDRHQQTRNRSHAPISSSGRRCHLSHHLLVLGCVGMLANK